MASFRKRGPYRWQAQGSGPAVAEAMAIIAELYRVEREIRDRELTGQAKLDYRSRQALPIVEVFFGWCHQQRQRIDLVHSEPLAKALGYAGNHQAQLKVYLGNPDVPIDTNHLERALRVIPMGRKNWLFNWTEVGARQVGIMMTFNLGAGVSFDSQHGRQFGIVVKYNRKTVTVAGRRRSSVARIARIIVTGERRRCRCRPRQKTEQEKTTAMPH